MELSEFTDAVARMTYEDIHAVKAAIVAHSQSAGDEVDAWRATITIDRALRLSGARRAAAHAAYSASQTVIAAAERPRVLVPDPEITAVARSAAELARAIVGGAARRRSCSRLWRSGRNTCVALVLSAPDLPAHR